MSSAARGAIRWISVPMATLLAMVISATSLAFVVDILSRFAIVRDAADIVAGIQGGVVAWATLSTARTVAPTLRRLVILLAFVGGAWAAWRVLGNWYFPELHPRAYQASKLPLTVTLVSGLVFTLAFWRGAESQDETRHRRSLSSREDR